MQPAPSSLRICVRATGSLPLLSAPAVVPKKDFQWVEWTEKKRPLTACQAAAQRGEKGGFIPQLTIGLLTHEPRSFGDSMETYLKYGLFEMVDE